MPIGLRFKDWKQGQELPPDSPVIPDHAVQISDAPG